MVRLDPNDAVLIATPSKTIVWTGEEPIRLFRWTRWRRARRHFVLRALPLGQLIDIERAIDITKHIGLASVVAVIAGDLAAKMPMAVQQAILDAHYEVNYPKAKAAESPSHTAPSSAASSPRTDSPPTTSSPA